MKIPPPATVELPSGATIQYVIEPISRFMVKRIMRTEDVRVEEDVAQVADILDARQVARSLTDFERRNPMESDARVLNYGDMEIH